MAQVWLFNVGHKRLAIRLELSESNEVLYIIAISCEHITGPFVWQKVRIQIIESINERSSVITVIKDTNAGFELTSSGGVTMVIAPKSDFTQSFDNFLDF